MALHCMLPPLKFSTVKLEYLTLNPSLHVYIYVKQSFNLGKCIPLSVHILLPRPKRWKEVFEVDVTWHADSLLYSLSI